MKPLTTVSTILSVAILTACGSGSSNDSAPEVSNNPFISAMDSTPEPVVEPTPEPVKFDFSIEVPDASVPVVIIEPTPEPVQVPTTGLIKQTNSSKICHTPASRYYDRTTNFTGFNSVDACMRNGGSKVIPEGSKDTYTTEIPQVAELTYSRSQFGSGWGDSDNDCLNTRAEILIEYSTIPITMSSTNACIVERGRWISSFTNEIITDASKMDIDHVIPLKWSWDAGADKWTRDTRESFANYYPNLIPVELELNRSKGAKGIQEWLPPTNRCGYIARFIRVAKIYDLPVTNADRELLSFYCD